MQGKISPADAGSPGPPGSGLRSRLGAIATILAAALAGAWVAMFLAGTTVRVGPVAVAWRVAPARQGVTELLLPPVGKVWANTHRTPLAISLLPARFEGRSTREILRSLTNRAATVRAMERDARRAAGEAVLRLLLLALLAGLAFGRLVTPARRRRVIAAGLLAPTLLAAFGLATVATYDRRAFRDLHFSGMLSEAPAAIDLLRRGMANVQKVRTQLRFAATNLARFYSQMESLSPGVTGEQVRLLHVSDLHNSQAGLEFTRTLAAQYRVDQIICTGDLTDYGTEQENKFVALWRGVGVGSLFVMGNHDSATTLAAVRRLPRAVVLEDGKVVEAAGLRFAGWADPASRRSGLGSVDTSLETLSALESQIRAALPELQPPPDVLVIHNYRVAEPLAGLVPTILYGHDHRPRVAQRAGSLLVDAGTTGANGIRYFTVAEPPPYSAALLTFRRGERRPLGVDIITVRALGGGFTVDHLSLESM
jgi:predicted phosphodiesterase